MWAESAWDLSSNKGQGVVVAVIDTGVAFENYSQFSKTPDLAQTTFVFPWNFIANNIHPNDDHGHGTHVTGTITQDTNTTPPYGVAGVAYNSTIMPLKVLDYQGSGSSDDLVEAITHAVQNGARVINMSLGFPGTGSPDASGTPCTEIVGLNTALENARSNNVVVVAASGNDGGSMVSCPAAYPTVIAVGATCFDGQVANYSNGGDSLDVTAPGGDLGVDQNVDGVLQETFCYDAFTLWIYYNLYGINLYGEPCDVFYSGTSMAAPHVTGTAALLLSEVPSLMPDDVRTYMESSARDGGPSGWDLSYGWGVLDASAALQMAQGGTAPTPPTTGDLTGKVTDAFNNSISGATVTASNSTGSVSTTTLNDGSYSIAVLACDGTYSVTASAKKYSSETVTSVVICPDTTLDFSLQKKGGGAGGGGGGGGRGRRN